MGVPLLGLRLSSFRCLVLPAMWLSTMHRLFVCVVLVGSFITASGWVRFFCFLGFWSGGWVSFGGVWGFGCGCVLLFVSWVVIEVQFCSSLCNVFNFLYCLCVC